MRRNYIHFSIEEDTDKENRTSYIDPNISDTKIKILKKSIHPSLRSESKTILLSND